MNDVTEQAVKDGHTTAGLIGRPVNRIEEEVRATIASLPGKTDAMVTRIARSACAMAAGAFRIRGACASELYRRTPKLKGGRGKKDAAGTGRKAFFQKLAADWKIDARTLEEDVRIFETLVRDEQKQDGADTVSFTALGREHYRAALLADDPRQALQHAAERIENGGYSVREMRAELAVPRAIGVRKITGSDTDAGNFAPTHINPINNAQFLLGDETVVLLERIVEAYNNSHTGTPITPRKMLQELVAQEADRIGLLPETRAIAA